MPNNDSSWTTVSNKSKGKTAPTSSKSSATNNIPKAEVKTIKLSDTPFSAMKNQIPDENGENEAPKVVTNNEKNPPVKVSKPTKPPSSSLTLKQALQNMNVEQLKQLCNPSNDNSMSWVDKVCYWFIEQLKETTSGLNDPILAKESNPEYPINALSSTVRDYMDQIFKSSKSKMKAITLCRNGMLHPNADNNVVTGYQVLLQYFLRQFDEHPPESFFSDIDEFSSTIKRYPMDKVLRLLWAYSQLQYKQPGLGLNIWFRLMLPLMENRSYNNFVVDTLTQLTTRIEKNKKALNPNEKFPMQSFLKLLKFVDRPNPALSKELRSTLSKSAMILSDTFCNSMKNGSPYGNEYFEILFRALHGDEQRTPKSQSAVNRMILSCMTDKLSVKNWFALHKEHPRSSLDLLSLLSTEKTSVPDLSSSKGLRNVIQQLRSISNGSNESHEHKDFLRVYANNDNVVANKRQTSSKSRFGSFLRWLLIGGITYFIYQNWLWLTVAFDYIFEDYLKHPTAAAVRQRLSEGLEETRKFTDWSLQYGTEYTRSTVEKIQPYALQYGQYFREQWFLFLRYLEGPVYDKSIEVAEQIQILSSKIFAESVYYLNILFDWASSHTAYCAHHAGIYLKQGFAILYETWSNFDGTELWKKFEEIRLRVIKSV